ncbi:hypothetical protein J2T12_000702 [Paenibacillus anaericanus]|nr:hypothetical protein [Paenibacillus anaericanus]
MIEMSSVWHDAVHSLNQSIAIIALDGTLQLVNQSWVTQASKHGLSPDWDRPGINLLRDFAAKEHSSNPLLQHLLQNFDSILQGDYPYFKTEFYWDFPQGRSWFLAEVIPFTKHGTTKIEGITLTCSDITAFKNSESQLKETISKISTLQGLLPICAVCKKIKDDHNEWNPIENYLNQHTCVEFTHDICPDCIRMLYPKYSSILDHPDNSEQASHKTCLCHEHVDHPNNP